MPTEWKVDNVQNGSRLTPQRDASTWQCEYLNDDHSAGNHVHHGTTAVSHCGKRRMAL